MPEPASDPRKLSNVQSNVIHECVLIRERANISQAAFALSLGKQRTYVWRWENGRWLDNADELIAAYAALDDGIDAGTIWRRAVKRWQQPAPPR